MKYKYKLIDRIKGSEITFNSKDELIKYFVKSMRSSILDFRLGGCWWTYEGKYHNNILDNMDFSGSDLDCNGEYKRYLLLDGYGRVIDGRIYLDEINKAYEIDVKSSNKAYVSYADREFIRNHCVFRKTPVPMTGASRYRHRCYRSPKMGRALRVTNIKEYEQFTRKKARVTAEQFWWDDFPRELYKSWKHQSKCRKQWEKGVKRKDGVYTIKTKRGSNWSWDDNECC